MSRSNSKIHPELSFEQIFRAYASIYNGVIRESLSESEEAVIDQLFATTVSVVTDSKANVVSISHQLKHLIRGYLQAGRICEVLYFQFLNDHQIEYKTHMTGLDGSYSMVHSIATIDKNTNKIVAIKPFNKDETTRILFEMKFREYFALYDGSSKNFGKAEEDIFMNLFADDFHVTVGDQTYNRQEWMKAMKACIKGGMKIDLQKFAFSRNSTGRFEYKLRVSNKDDNKEGDGVVLNSVGYVVNGKFASFIPSSDNIYLAVFPSALNDPKKDASNKENVATKNKEKRTGRKGRGGRLRLWVPVGWDRKGFGMI